MLETLVAPPATTPSRGEVKAQREKKILTLEYALTKTGLCTKALKCETHPLLRNNTLNRGLFCTPEEVVLDTKHILKPKYCCTQIAEWSKCWYMNVLSVLVQMFS